MEVRHNKKMVGPFHSRKEIEGCFIGEETP